VRASPLAEQMRLLGAQLGDDPGRGRSTAAGRLTADLRRAVPSLLSVQLVLPRWSGDLAVTVGPAPAHGRRRARASMTVPLSGTAPTVLVARAARAGAFVLLADDLAGQRSPVPGDRELVLDEHRQAPWLLSPAALDAALDAASAADRAVGVLIARGLTTEQARGALQREARQAGLPLAVVAAELLASTAR
jgi:hypothetical protein